METWSEADIAAALDDCASEPIATPNSVQPFATLVAFTGVEGNATHISANAADLFGRPIGSLFAEPFSDILGRTIWHDISNARGYPDFGEQATRIGTYDLCGRTVSIGGHLQGYHTVLEIEPLTETATEAGEDMRRFNFLMRKVRDCTSLPELFQETARMMRFISGYDRVMIYKFDASWNGEVVAEARRASLESFDGLRFPSHDIPSNARDIMRKLPLRLICNINDPPAPLMARRPSEPPLDLTLAVSRGVSPVHLDYLRNMGSVATMTLSVMIEDRLWGIISFHHERPRVPPSGLRDVLTAFIPIFAGRLQALLQDDTLRRISMLDAKLVDPDGDDRQLEDAMPVMAPIIFEIFDAKGFATLMGSQSSVFGKVPDRPVMDALLAALVESAEDVLAIDCLSERFPDLEAHLNGCAGVLVARVQPLHAVCVFRPSLSQQAAWAGNPEKAIDRNDGRLRLRPRGSFSTYLQNTEGHAQPWRDEDITFIKHVRTMIYASQRQSLVQRLNRQQSLMIDELNHRVRNILALVRSVSRQARRRYGSLDSYAKSIESRIKALAAAHDLASGAGLGPTSLRSLIEQELAPFGAGMVEIEGDGRLVKPEFAPILSLVVHELATNAAKYGAFSAQNGKVKIALLDTNAGARITWQESGGPPVQEPSDLGFGSTLIRKAVPHELGGAAELDFAPDGVRAIIDLPFSTIESRSVLHTAQLPPPLALDPAVPFSAQDLSGYVLLVEDNFIIANEMRDQLLDFGFDMVEMVSTVDDALYILARQEPLLAVLDVNLGQGQTSAPLADKLKAMEIPFLFVTGYGEATPMARGFRGVPKATKPVTTSELERLLADLLSS